MYDIIIIGAGPSGLTAAIYSSIANKKILILEKDTYGGQILKANSIKNYPGFNNITGYEFAEKLYNQVKKFNPDIIFEEVIKIKDNKNFKEVITKQSSYKAKSIIIATGAENRKLNLDNEKKFLGKGISYCATCDAVFYKNKIVAVYGGGNAAISDALFLSDIAKEVYLIYRKDSFKVDSIDLKKLKKKSNTKILLNSVITSLNGNDYLKSISINNDETITIDGLFIDIGHIPVSSICDNLININDNGYIISSENCKTNVEGIFVSGDVRSKDIRQLTTACSDGTNAAINASIYLKKID
ncbi:MAG: FAD-dependent oxidoreductase [bacterium]|nr:FAD-dependent oxidoreductase [bacterium]